MACMGIPIPIHGIIHMVCTGLVCASSIQCILYHGMHEFGVVHMVCASSTYGKHRFGVVHMVCASSTYGMHG